MLVFQQFKGLCRIVMSKYVGIFLEGMDFFDIIVGGNIDIYVLNKNIETEQMFCYNIVIHKYML